MKRYAVAFAALACAAVATPAAAAPYRLPLRADNLTPDQRYSTFVHKEGIQADGKDIGARRHKSDSNWPGLKTDNADRKVLANWIVYGKPFYAMAPGKVVACWRNAPENTPGGYHPDFVAGKIPRAGNHLWILQDDGVYALYAHARPGSIPTGLCPNNASLLTNTAATKGNPAMRIEAQVADGARVLVGQKLGEVGNSGASEGGPHLHVHMEKDDAPVPMLFARGMTTPFAGDKASLDGPWTRLAGKAMPKATILFWAHRPVGNYTFNGVKSADYQRMVEHLADSGMMPSLVTCASNGATYDSKWVPAQGQWTSHHGMTAADAAAKHALYTSQGFKRTSSYTCGSVSVAVWWKAA